MRLTSVFVGERVEHAERPRPQPEGEPEGRRRLLLRHRQPRFQQLRDLVFLAGLGFQPGEQGDTLYGTMFRLLGDLPGVPANAAGDDRQGTYRQTGLYITWEKRGLRALLSAHKFQGGITGHVGGLWVALDHGS